MDEQPSEEPAEPAQEKPQREHVPPDYHKNKSRKKWVIPILIVLLIAGAGAGGYWYKTKSKTTSEPSTTSQTVTTKQQEVGQINQKTKHYDSPNFYLGLDYPTDWEVADAGGGKMTITSPVLQLKSAQGRTTKGEIILSIYQKGQNLTAFDAGNAVAVLDSEKLTYTKPSQNQRGSTYISFLRYAKTTLSGALDGVYITGNNGYQKDQNIPKTDIAGVDPQISITFTQCSDGTCSTTPRPLSIASSSWDDAQLSTPIKKMLSSLTIN